MVEDGTVRVADDVAVVLDPDHRPVQPPQTHTELARHSLLLQQALLAPAVIGIHVHVDGVFREQRFAVGVAQHRGQEGVRVEDAPIGRGPVEAKGNAGKETGVTPLGICLGCQLNRLSPGTGHVSTPHRVRCGTDSAIGLPLGGDDELRRARVLEPGRGRMAYLVR